MSGPLDCGEGPLANLQTHLEVRHLKHLFSGFLVIRRVFIEVSETVLVVFNKLEKSQRLFCVRKKISFIFEEELRSRSFHRQCLRACIPTRYVFSRLNSLESFFLLLGNLLLGPTIIPRGIGSQG